MKGKQVLLTGGTGGLGLGVTPVVLETGASTVTIPFHSEKGIQREGLWGESNSPPCKPRLKSKLSAVDFERIRFVKADLNQESAVEQLVNELGRIDVLIHLVGGFSMGATEQFSFADWQKSFALNLDTTFLVCKHSLRVMRKHGYGRIVTVGSRGAVSPAANLAAYCAAKAGVVALTQVICPRNQGHGHYC